MTDVTTSTDTQAEATDTTAQTGVQLHYTDLENAIKVIDFACDQGAFKGWANVQAAWQVRSKLQAFVDTVRPADEPAAEAAQPSAEVVQPVDTKTLESELDKLPKPSKTTRKTRKG